MTIDPSDFSDPALAARLYGYPPTTRSNMSSFWNTLNPKVKAQVLGFAAIAVATLGAAALGKLGAGTTIGVLFATGLTIVVGYLKSAAANETPPPAA